MDEKNINNDGHFAEQRQQVRVSSPATKER
uniref:Uncharacterized protein n=1 Tax=Nelumbo nucifera TaxID=4432 RepID=A0A822ZT50_NELNU|nr:TPA_asm: hypothetical protein HUJ06_019031 [Nelumbo nucifera]